MTSDKVRATLKTDEHGSEIHFYRWSELRKWLNRERAVWDWLQRGDGRTDTLGWATQIQTSFDNITNEVATLEAQGQSITTADGLLNNFSSAGSLFASESAGGTLILEIKDVVGDVAASFAYALMKKAVAMSQAGSREHLQGAVLVAFPEMTRAADLSSRLQRERANYRSATRSMLSRLKEAEEERNEAAATLTRRIRRIAAGSLENRKKFWNRGRTLWQIDATAAVDSIKGVEAAYSEAMGLQAPVQYWTDKALKHGTKERRAMVQLLCFFPTAVLILGGAFSAAAYTILRSASVPGSMTPVALYVVISGGLALLSTIAFWIGRILTKLYLSEHHLRNDAEERAVMTTTYLALTKEKGAEEADRHIVLQALFRNTPDGIVKDDGPSDLNIQALLSRLLAK